MKFYLDEISTNKASVVLNSDNSFKTINNEEWNFQISVEPYTVLLLNFNYEAKVCTGIEGYLNLFKCFEQVIRLNIIKRGVLKTEDFPVSKDAFGIEYKLLNSKCYFDNSEKIFGIGDVEYINDVLEIGNGQYVKIKNGQILALFIKFSYIN